MKSFLLTILIFSSTLIISQESNSTQNSLDNQFDKIYRTSSSYQEFKVIRKQRFLNLKQNVLDSLKSFKNLVSEKNNLLTKEKENLESINLELSKVKLDLENANKKENSISFLGISIKKGTYNLLVWFLIGILFLTTLYFVFKFTRSNVLTKKAEDNLYEVEKEFESHRKKSLEREQKLRRKLQDEINKQRNS